jgi:hypothetical protein
MLVVTSFALATILAISTIAFISMQGRSLPSDEPISLADIIKYPGSYEMYDLSPEEVETQMIDLELTGALMGISLEGYHEMKSQLLSKGYDFPAESFFDVCMSSVHLTTPEGDMFVGATFYWWSEEGPNGTKALLAGAAMMNVLDPIDQSSIIFGTPTNVLPPEEMPGVDPYIIWNAEPYFYFQFYWYHPYIYYPPYYKIVYWNYWWYDSHKSPNWFWGSYWWWRTYIYAHPIDLPYRPWYWWWWHWYYWRPCYYWSTYWLY